MAPKDRIAPRIDDSSVAQPASGEQLSPAEPRLRQQPGGIACQATAAAVGIDHRNLPLRGHQHVAQREVAVGDTDPHLHAIQPFGRLDHDMPRLAQERAVARKGGPSGGLGIGVEDLVVPAAEIVEARQPPPE